VNIKSEDVKIKILNNNENIMVINYNIDMYEKSTFGDYNTI